MKNYLWYAGYGSNLDRQRFHCYIEGGKPTWAKNKNKGCKDRTLPDDSKSHIIHHRLCFGWFDKQGAKNWEQGGVAFVDPVKSISEVTYCRIWKITEDQYQGVRQQEGLELYNHEIFLGFNDGIPILTITSCMNPGAILPPKSNYLKTIARGLRETYSFNSDAFIKYMNNKDGIRGEIGDTELAQVYADSEIEEPKR